MTERRSRPRGRPDLVDVTVRVPAEKAGALRAYASRLGRQRAPVGRDEVLSILGGHPDLFARFGVRAAALFGSVGRDQARPLSDVNLLVDFRPGQPGGLLRYVELKHALEGLLGRPVDLVTRAGIKPRLRERILAEAIPVVQIDDDTPGTAR